MYAPSFGFALKLKQKLCSVVHLKLDDCAIVQPDNILRIFSLLLWYRVYVTRVYSYIITAYACGYSIGLAQSHYI